MIPIISIWKLLYKEGHDIFQLIVVCYQLKYLVKTIKRNVFIAYQKGEFMTKGFTLEKLKVIHKKRIIFDVTFVDDEQNREKLLSTVIIGINGAGKSYLLTIIAEVFRTLKIGTPRNDYSLKYDEYYVEYILDNSKYQICIKKNIFESWKDGKLIDSKDIVLPNKILAVSYMLNDKFIFKGGDSVNQDGYEYLGIRQASNAAWTTSISKKVCDALLNLFVNKERSVNVREVLEFLGFDNRVSIVYESNIKSLFKKKLAKKVLKGRVEKYSKSEDLRSKNIQKNKDVDSQERLLNFVNNIDDILDQRYIVKSNDVAELQYPLDFSSFKEKDRVILEEDYSQLRTLVDLRLINAPKLILYKNEKKFDFDYASSGEKHLLFTLFNISLKIDSNSLVLIDEPELSLHPNWQMQYINYIKKLFLEFWSCHFLFATHSHYMVSDLETDSSSLVVLSSAKNKNIDRVAELIEYSTYAWSAENILYNIFQVRTTRNYYFEMDLRTLINMIEEKKTDISGMKKLIKKLTKYVYDENDPLKMILKNAQEYMEKCSL